MENNVNTSSLLHFSCHSLFQKKKILFFFQNIMVMGPGTLFFLGCVGYIIYMRMNEDKNSYTAMNEDGTLTQRPRTSRWD